MSAGTITLCVMVKKKKLHLLCVSPFLAVRPRGWYNTTEMFVVHRNRSVCKLTGAKTYYVTPVASSSYVKHPFPLHFPVSSDTVRDDDAPPTPSPPSALS